MIDWTRALGCTLLMALASCADAPAATGDGGGSGDAGACVQQNECPCTCTCPSGFNGVTYSNCVDGTCQDCTLYCNAWCG